MEFPSKSLPENTLSWSKTTLLWFSLNDVKKREVFNKSQNKIKLPCWSRIFQKGKIWQQRTHPTTLESYHFNVLDFRVFAPSDLQVRSFIFPAILPESPGQNTRAPPKSLMHAIKYWFPHCPVCTTSIGAFASSSNSSLQIMRPPIY